MERKAEHAVVGLSNCGDFCLVTKVLKVTIYPSIYSLKTKKLFKLMALIAIIILLISITSKFILADNIHNLLSDFRTVFGIAQNIAVIIVLLIYFFFPEKVGIFGIIAFYYSVVIFLSETDNIMGLFMYFLGVSIFYARGHYNKNGKIKKIITGCVLFTLILSEIRFGKTVFVNAVISYIGYSFVFFCLLYFIQIFTFNFLESKNSDKKLNIKKYPDLHKRDAEWLKRIQKGEKYKCIAIDEKMSVGSVKNRLKIIFEKLYVDDKRGFLNKYSDFDIIYEENISE